MICGYSTKNPPICQGGMARKAVCKATAEPDTQPHLRHLLGPAVIPAFSWALSDSQASSVQAGTCDSQKFSLL